MPHGAVALTCKYIYHNAPIFWHPNRPRTVGLRRLDSNTTRSRWRTGPMYSCHWTRCVTMCHDDGTRPYTNNWSSSLLFPPMLHFCSWGWRDNVVTPNIKVYRSFYWLHIIHLHNIFNMQLNWPQADSLFILESLNGLSEIVSNTKLLSSESQAALY